MDELINCVKSRGTLMQVKRLVRRGADVNYQDQYGKTALDWCSEYNQPELEETGCWIVSYLIYYGAYLNIRDRDGRTPLMSFIIKNCSKTLIFLLIDRGAEVSCRDLNLQTAMHFYANYKGKSLALFKVMLSRFMCIDDRDCHGDTPLMLFVKHGSENQYIYLLLIAGSNVILRSYHGNTVLHYYAIGRHRIENDEDLYILKRLVICRGLLNEKNFDGQTPLMLFVLHKLPPKDVKFLLDSGADIHAQDLRGETALHMVFLNLDILYSEVIEILLEYGGNPNCTNFSGETLLFRALYCSDIPEHIELLYNYGLNRVVGHDFIGALINYTYPFSSALQVVVKYMVLESETALDGWLCQEVPDYHHVRSYIDSLIEELTRMKTRILVHDLVLFDFLVEPDRRKFCWSVRNCSLNNNVLTIEFPHYARILISKFRTSVLYFQ